MLNMFLLRQLYKDATRTARSASISGKPRIAKTRNAIRQARNALQKCDSTCFQDYQRIDPKVSDKTHQCFMLTSQWRLEDWGTGKPQQDVVELRWRSSIGGAGAAESRSALLALA